MSNNNPWDAIRHVFVLALENRSFDHMLGFSGITGTDAVTGRPTQVNGLAGNEFNSFGGTDYPVTPGNDFVMSFDPPHEFPDVLRQLCGAAATYPPGGPYPLIDNSGFVADYVASGALDDPGEVMRCYTPEQLPVLNALAREFAVCDDWHASMPGPTWPNRFFLHAASSGGLDHSPAAGDIALWEGLSGFAFQNGTLFDALGKFKPGSGWRIYAGDDFPNAAALKGVHPIFDVFSFDRFRKDVGSPGYAFPYTFIEPNYGDVIDNTYSAGTSQHPLDDVTHGEALIKQTYEAIRNSPLWDNSLLIVTWDEHGGFYDHVAPPPAVPPADRVVTSSNVNTFGFAFDRYGPRVPAVVASPLIPRNLIDHRLYDHASVPATVEALFGLRAMTARDLTANPLTPLVSLASPRTDAPTTLPRPAASASFAAAATARTAAAASRSVARPTDPIDKGNLPGFLHAALRSDLAVSPGARPAVMARFATLRTRAQARQYMDEVRLKVRAARHAQHKAG